MGFALASTRRIGVRNIMVTSRCNLQHSIWHTVSPSTAELAQHLFANRGALGLGDLIRRAREHLSGLLDRRLQLIDHCRLGETQLLVHRRALDETELAISFNDTAHPRRCGLVAKCAPVSVRHHASTLLLNICIYHSSSARDIDDTGAHEYYLPHHAHRRPRRGGHRLAHGRRPCRPLLLHDRWCLVDDLCMYCVIVCCTTSIRLLRHIDNIGSISNVGCIICGGVRVTGNSLGVYCLTLVVARHRRHTDNARAHRRARARRTFTGARKARARKDLIHRRVELVHKRRIVAGLIVELAPHSVKGHLQKRRGAIACHYVPLLPLIATSALASDLTSNLAKILARDVQQVVVAAREQHHRVCYRHDDTRQVIHTIL